MKRFVVDAHGRLRWLWQCVLLFLLYFVLAAFGEIFITGQVMAILPDDRETAYLIADVLINTLIALALLLGFRWITGRGVADMGLRLPDADAAWKLAAGLGIGAAAIGLMAVLLSGMGDISLRAGGQAGHLALHVLYFVSVSVVEEVLTRGALQHAIANAGHPWPALVIPSVFFGLLHLGNASVTALAVVNTTLAGLLLALYVHRDGSLWRAMGFHFTWNYFLSIVFGMTVSGADYARGQFFVAVLNRRTLFNGGAYGVEGGLLGTVVLLGLIGIEWLILWKGKGKAGLTPS